MTGPDQGRPAGRTPPLFWHAEAGGAWVRAGAEWSAFTGLTEAESRGLGWLEAVHPEDRAATLAAWRGAEAGVRGVDHRLRGADGHHHWFRSQAIPPSGPGGGAAGWTGVSVAVGDLVEAGRRRRLALEELQHRARNMLGVIRSIVRRTAQVSTTLEDCTASIDGRLAALTRVQAVVIRDPLGGVDLAQMLADEFTFSAVQEGERVRMEGPPIRLPAKAATTFGLALHELVANALAHGALASPQGRVTVTWSVVPDGAGTRLRFDWREAGPACPPSAPPRQGFGTELLLRTLPYELKATTRMNHEAEGLHVEIGFLLTGAPHHPETPASGAASREAR